jgi:hypothetical protein
MNRLLPLGALAIALAAGGYFAYSATQRSGRETANTSSSIGPADAPQTPSANHDEPTRTANPPETAASTPDADNASLPTRSAPLTPVHWLNIADASLGGKIERVSSASDEREWQPPNLIDNGTGDIVCTPFCSWAAKDATFPQDIVLSFYQRREARIGRVVLDTLTSLTRTSESPGLPRQVEIAVSTTSPVDEFETIASLELPRDWTEQPIDLKSTPAKYLRVRILSAYGDTRVVLGEIRVFEADAAPSILADFPRNLALPALGGAIVSYTSDYTTYEVSRLTDGKPAAEWRSADDYLPQEFVFAFHDDAVALIDRMVLTTKANLATAPKVVTVSASVRSPVDGFDAVGTFTLKQSAADQSIPIGRKARFVKLRILENFGGGIFTGLGEVQLVEGSAAGYESALVRRGSDPGADAAGPAPCR